MYYIHRLTKDLGYQHVKHFLQDQTSTELSGWLEYERMTDEIIHQRLVYAIVTAFNGSNGSVATENEPVIDTTDPDFLKHFTGFINDPSAK